MHIIYGLLDQPLASPEQLNLSRIHTGLQRILMLRPDTPAPALPPDVQTLDVVAPDVVIPTQETTYWCSIHKLPENMAENHIVMVKKGLPKGGDSAQAAIIAAFFLFFFLVASGGSKQQMDCHAWQDEAYIKANAETPQIEFLRNSARFTHCPL